GAVWSKFAFTFGDEFAERLARAAFITPAPGVRVAAIVSPREPIAWTVCVRPRPPAVPADKTSPPSPPRQPGIRVIIAPIALAIEPIILSRTEIHMMIVFTENLVGDCRMGYRRAEIIARLDLRRNFLPKPRLGFGGLHRDFELRLFIFLDA